MNRAFLFSIFVLCVLLSSCRVAAPGVGLERIDSPSGALPTPTPRPVEVDARPVEPHLPDFSETVDYVLEKIDAAIQQEGQKTPVIRIADDDFEATAGLDKTWITKHLRIELNTLANGRILFVDSLSDSHAEEYHTSSYSLGGDWNTTSQGFDLTIRLVSRDNQQMLWGEKLSFR